RVAVAWRRRQSGGAVDCRGDDARRHRQVGFRLALQRRTHERHPDRQRGLRAELLVAERFEIIETDPDGGDEVVVEAVEPAVAIVVGCTGLPARSLRPSFFTAAPVPSGLSITLCISEVIRKSLRGSITRGASKGPADAPFDSAFAVLPSAPGSPAAVSGCAGAAVVLPSSSRRASQLRQACTGSAL